MGSSRLTKEYKAEVVALVVVALVLNERKSVGVVCRELDLPESAVRRPARAPTTTEREELSGLRREVRQLRMERDILRKATAFFAKDNG